ncbi:unnamed protein product [Gadus morhua 'NCC']
MEVARAQVTTCPATLPLCLARCPNSAVDLHGATSLFPSGSEPDPSLSWIQRSAQQERAGPAGRRRNVQVK